MPSRKSPEHGQRFKDRVNQIQENYAVLSADPGTLLGNSSTDIAPPGEVSTSSISTPPGGTSGQIQYNNSGSLGGFTASGDATVNTSTGSVTVSKTGGVSFGYFATGTAASNLTGTLPASCLPTPSASTLGGVESYAAVSHQWINQISTAGVPSSTQPAFTDISGSASSTQIATNLSAAIDSALGSTQGDILYRGASGWSVLAPGTSGQFLETLGASANPQWQTVTLGSGAEVLISTQTVSGSSTSTVSFTSIPGTYTDLRVVVRGRGDTSATNVGVNITFNSDTGTNYFYQRLGGANSAASAAAVASTTSLAGAELPAATATANLAGFANTRIYDYKGTTFTKIAESFTSYPFSTSTTGQVLQAWFSWWNSTAAITRIDLTMAAGNFVAGSKISLYGIN